MLCKKNLLTSNYISKVIIPSSLSPDGKYKTSEESRTLGLTEGLNNSDFVMDDPLNTSNNEYNARTSNKIISKRVGEPHLRENSTPLPSRKVSSSPSARQPQIAKRSPATKPSPVRRPTVTPSPSAIKVKPPLDSYLYKSGAGSRTRNGMNSSGKKTRSTSLPSHVHRSRSFESLTEVVAQHYKDSLLKKRPKYIK